MSAEHITLRLAKDIDVLPLSGTVSPEDLARTYPYLRREYPIPHNPTSTIDFHPQSGEFDRFGVFFWAFEDLSFTIGDSNPSKHVVVCETNILFQYTINNKDIVKKGIMVVPSQYEQSVWRQYDPNGTESRSITKAMEIGRKINEDHVVLDLRVTRRGLKPILSIPTQVSIPREMTHYSTPLRRE